MELEMDDLELIHALQIAPRVGWTDAGAVLGRHPTTLASRWSRLRAGGLAWVTGHLMGSPDQMTLSLHDIDCEPGQRSDVAEALCCIPEVISVEETARNRDFTLTVITRDWAELTRRVIPQFADIPGMVRYQSALVTAHHAGGNAWRLDVLSPAQQSALRRLARPPSSPVVVRLPAAYWPIVRVLGRDGRATAADIAAVTGQHPSTVRRQLAKVLDSGTLSFRCEIAQDYSGFPISCQWYANVPPSDHTAAAGFLARYRNLRFCASTTGSSNFTFVLWLRDASGVAEIESEFLAAVPTARILESSVTVNFLKRVGWRLAPDGTSTGEVVVPQYPAAMA
ncbi:Lrp/AsnC family transcriptional regulator [Arthrobacter sp. H5]|uniref:Lrp/AsnC family transcriptional regulator n=1 Tax=Arthrobacter sp. H5 TaxID=1267973 RepID=UPI000482848A|nr:Lrp/AsnC family transcriptional regulator [Arthrobacter sp. H5]